MTALAELPTDVVCDILVVQKVLGLDQTHFRGRLYFPLVFNIPPFARLCQGPTVLELVDARAEELFFQSFKPQHYSSLQVLIVSKMLSPEAFLQAREQPEVAWGEIWAVGWMIQFAEAAFPHSILCNVRLVHWSVVVKQQHPTTQLPTALLLHCTAQLLQEAGVVSPCDGLLVCEEVNQQHTLDVPEHSEHDLASR